jgi:hypothetical protein
MGFKLLHRSRNYFIKEYNVNSKKTLVTFTPWVSTVPRNDKNADGFGEGLFQGHGINELHIVARLNHWYQCPVLKNFFEEYKSKNLDIEFVCYGSSMGAFAALLYSPILEARCVSLSPQFSIDRNLVPFEKRWEKESRSIDFKYTIETYLNDGLLIYDHASMDHKHGRLIREKRPNYKVFAKSFLGHPSGKAFNSFYNLKALVISFVDGSFSFSKCSELYNESKRQSDWYWNNMAYELLSFGRLDLATAYKNEFEKIESKYGKKVYFIQKLLKKI